MLIARTKSATVEGGIVLVRGALARLSTDVVQQALPTVYDQCKAAQGFPFQIIFSEKEALRLSIESVPNSTCSQLQGVYSLKTWRDWQLVLNAVEQAEGGTGIDVMQYLSSARRATEDRAEATQPYNEPNDGDA